LTYTSLEGQGKEITKAIFSDRVAGGAAELNRSTKATKAGQSAPLDST
jgi:hypothetical protein